MNCEKYLILIDDFIEGELDGESAAQVNSHLSNCRECDSYYAIVRGEKEIYGKFLFAVEPPPDLWNQFQTKIETLPVAPKAAEQNVSGSWNFNIFSYFRLYPALGFAAVLIFCAYGVWKFTPPETIPGNSETAQNNSDESQTPVQTFGEIAEEKPQFFPAKDNTKKPARLPAAIKKAGTAKNESRTLKDKFSTARRAENVQPKAKKAFDAPKPAQLTEEQLQLKAVETETALQIEKIELLLRAFRNARVVEGSTVYDVAYEKQQARNLLGKNVLLRQAAEAYGALYTEELLDKAEPFLLDIANLENNPQPEKVLDIKERVKNQNIIASLQVY